MIDYILCSNAAESRLTVNRNNIVTDADSVVKKLIGLNLDEVKDYYEQKGITVTLAPAEQVPRTVRVIVAGSRTFDDYDSLKERLDFLLKDTDLQTVEIVSGKARGADALGEAYAKERNLPIKPFPAEWEKYGRKIAGPIRNRQMAQYATHAVVFWDGKSRGSADMIRQARTHGLKLRKVFFIAPDAFPMFCPYREDLPPVTVTKVKAEYGWLGNMSRYPIIYQGKEYKTAEALFQALRFLAVGEEDIAEEIRAENSPMGAKMKAKKYREHLQRNPELDYTQDDLDTMRFVLNLKVEQHPELVDWLMKIRDRVIIEDRTARPRGSAFFWGSVRREEFWEGQNWLGRLWMEIIAHIDARLSLGQSPLGVASLRCAEAAQKPKI